MVNHVLGLMEALCTFVYKASNNFEIMSMSMTLKGMIKGMEMMGATFVKADEFNIFFDIPKNGEIDDDVKLKKARDAFVKKFGLGLRVRRI